MKRSELKRTAPLRRDTGGARLTVAVPRRKKCKACKDGFLALRPLQTACSPACALELAKAQREKTERAADRAQREKLKPRSQWLREAQSAFNAWVRLRDAGRPCISCNRHHDGQWHAGHFLSTGARPELRFDESNVHLQCQPCNVHLHGNLVLYRAELIRRLGLHEVERLEGPHEPRKYVVDELKAIRDKYRALARELKAKS